MLNDSEISVIIKQLNNLSTELKKQKMLSVIAGELDDIAIRLNRVYINHVKHLTSDKNMLNYLNVQDDEWT